eukprot:TRINITY_DN5399_c0_g2_i1.p1 TRINITY_DN5399_c0_g2~~TRINITY_DN5399_c0_g2_i1.p1  ORF type:complete len:2164 (+),score=579.96 TRINITY_DN5399_c0_g2_i1:271-6492(+)
MGTFVKNRLSHNRGQNVRVLQGANPTMRLNTLAGGDFCGVLVDEGGRGLYEKNTVEDNGDGFAVMGADSSPTILACKIRKNRQAGVTFGSNARGTLLRCTVSENAVDVRVLTGASPLVERNDLFRSPSGLIVGDRGSCPEIRANELSGHNTAIRIEKLASPIVRANTMISAQHESILVQTGGGGQIEGNDISSCAVGIATASGARPLVMDNDIHNCLEGAVEIRDDGGGEMRNNTLRSNAAGVLVTGTKGSAVIAENIVISNVHGVRAFVPSELVPEHLQQAPTQQQATAVSRVYVKLDDPLRRVALLQRNTISESSSANVLVEARGDVSLVENNVHTAPVGVLCRQGGFGAFTENTLRGHADANFKVTSSGCPTAERNVLEDSPVGITVTEGGAGRFVGNELSGHRLQIFVASFGDPQVEGCKMVNGTGTGMTIRHRGMGYFKRNVFSNNRQCGLEIESESKPVVEDNEISENDSHGVVVHQEGMGLIRLNRISCNVGAGVLISRDSRPTVAENQIFQNGLGVDVLDGGYGVIEKNDLHRNKGPALQIAKTADPLVCGNSIHHSRVGVLLLQTQSARLLENVLEECQTGVECRSTTDPIIEGNTFRANVVACRTAAAARCTLSKNVFDVNFVGLEVGERSEPTVKENVFKGGSMYWHSSETGDCTGVLVRDDGHGLFDSNVFERLTCGMRTTGVGVRPVVEGNEFRGNTGRGLVVEDGSCPEVYRNTFTKNKGSGFLVRQKGNPEAVDNLFTAELVCALRVEEGGLGTFTDNKFDGNARGATVHGAGTAPEFKENWVRDNELGIVFEQGAGGRMRDNFFERNSRCGVQILTEANPAVVHNAFAFHAAGSTALDVSHFGSGEVEANLFANSAIGVRIAEGATPTVRQNLMSGCDVGVLSVLSGSGLVKCCAFRSNKTDVRTENGGNTTFQQNVLGTVESSDGGAGLFSGNVFTGRVTVDSDATPHLQSNSICGYGVVVESGGRGEFEQNTFYGLHQQAPAAVEVASGGCPDMKKNTFVQCSRGVWCHDGGLGEYRENLLLGGKVGIEVSKGGDPHFGAGNMVESMDRCMVVTGAGAKGTFDGVAFVAGQTACVYVEKEGNPVLRECDVYDGKIGVLVSGGGLGEFNACNVFDCARVGFVIDEEGAPALLHNKISSPFGMGALEKKQGAAATLEGNKVRHQFSPQVGRRPAAPERELEHRRVPARIRKMIGDLESSERDLMTRNEQAAQQAFDLFSRWGINEATGVAAPRRVYRTRAKPRKSIAAPGTGKPLDASASLDAAVAAAEQLSSTLAADVGDKTGDKTGDKSRNLRPRPSGSVSASFQLSTEEPTPRASPGFFGVQSEHNISRLSSDRTGKISESELALMTGKNRLSRRKSSAGSGGGRRKSTKRRGSRRASRSPSVSPPLPIDASPADEPLAVPVVTSPRELDPGLISLLGIGVASEPALSPAVVPDSASAAELPMSRRSSASSVRGETPLRTPATDSLPARRRDPFARRSPRGSEATKTSASDAGPAPCTTAPPVPLQRHEQATATRRGPRLTESARRRPRASTLAAAALVDRRRVRSATIKGDRTVRTSSRTPRDSGASRVRPSMGSVVQSEDVSERQTSVAARASGAGLSVAEGVLGEWTRDKDAAPTPPPSLPPPSAAEEPLPPPSAAPPAAPTQPREAVPPDGAAAEEAAAAPRQDQASAQAEPANAASAPDTAHAAPVAETAPAPAPAEAVHAASVQLAAVHPAGPEVTPAVKPSTAPVSQSRPAVSNEPESLLERLLQRQGDSDFTPSVVTVKFHGAAPASPPQYLPAPPPFLERARTAPENVRRPCAAPCPVDAGGSGGRADWLPPLLRPVSDAVKMERAQEAVSRHPVIRAGCMPGRPASPTATRSHKQPSKSDASALPSPLPVCSGKAARPPPDDAPGLVRKQSLRQVSAARKRDALRRKSHKAGDSGFKGVSDWVWRVHSSAGAAGGTPPVSPPTSPRSDARRFPRPPRRRPPRIRTSGAAGSSGPRVWPSSSGRITDRIHTEGAKHQVERVAGRAASAADIATKLRRCAPQLSTASVETAASIVSAAAASHYFVQ